MLESRHIQNFSEAASLSHHWGYADRAVPCTNDAGSCAYLDVVYHSHDLGMIYTGILWATIGGILLIWALGRHFFNTTPSGVRSASTPLSASERSIRAVRSLFRRSLMPDAVRPIFGRVSRVQVLTLIVLAGYLIVWTFVGIVYNTWITPVKKKPGVFNTRTSLGPWSDRIGMLAYALTPLSIMLSSRESILSLVTGLPYQSFNFLHRWLGYIMFIQSAMHTIGWSVIELRLYQPQPTVGIEWIKQPYMIWGVVAMFLLTVMVCLSTPWGIRLTGYEVFRKLHYVMAMIYIGACWGHWEKLKVFLLPSLIVWFLDRFIRLVRSALLHYQFLPSGHMGFTTISANTTVFEDLANGDVVRLDFEHDQDAWKVGQHFYLCFPEHSIWQSHPFTPLSLPLPGALTQQHSYIFRAKKGQTKKVANGIRRALTQMSKESDISAYNSLLSVPKLKVILTGPYGEDVPRAIENDCNVLCVAGGTGITYVLPVLLDLASQPQNPDRKISLIWAVRQRRDIDWIAPELDLLKRRCRSLRSSLHIYVTRNDNLQSAIAEKAVPTACAYDVEASGSGTSSSDSFSSALSINGVTKADLQVDHFQRRPELELLVGEFVESTVSGPTRVVASGPGAMLSDLKSIVARLNDGAKVWKGQVRYDVGLTCDDRLEW